MFVWVLLLPYSGYTYSQEKIFANFADLFHIRACARRALWRALVRYRGVANVKAIREKFYSRNTLIPAFAKIFSREINPLYGNRGTYIIHGVLVNASTPECNTQMTVRVTRVT